MIEAQQTRPEVSELIRRVQDEGAFLRMAVNELRRMAEEAPELAAELRQIAAEIEVEAKMWPTSGDGE